MWDLEDIKNQQVTDNVVEMMVQKINNLPKNSSHILKVCACVGNRFDLETLSEASGISIDNVLIDLTLAIEVGLISEHSGGFRFHHDRIEEAAYSMISKDDKVNLHYKIGTIVLKETDEIDIEGKIFYILHHMNKVIPLIKSKDDKLRLAELNKIAGDRAISASAFDSAFSYYEIGESLLSEESWENNYELTFYLNLKIAENNYITGNPKKADKRFQQIIKKAKTKIDKGSVYHIWIDLLQGMEEYETGLDFGKKARKLFKISLNIKPTVLSVVRNILFFKYYMKKNLLKKIMSIVMENAGVQKDFLLLETDGVYAIEARCEVDSDDVVVLESTPVEQSDELPHSIIQFVGRKAESVILDNAMGDQVYSTDSYIKSNNIKSILCFPVLNQGKVSGILYLENNLITNAFTSGGGAFFDFITGCSFH